MLQKKHLSIPRVLTTVFKPFSRIVMFLFVASLFLAGCGQLPKLTGTNQVFVTSGSADDGDDATNGPAMIYVNPNRTATDGQAKAVSDPKDFKSLEGNVIAQTGPQPIRISAVISTNKVTSSFV